MVPKPRLDPPRTTALLLLLATAARARSHHDVSAEAASFVPQCARECFRSFVDVNFSDIDCGEASSLECVCQRTGASGYTIGEGAVQCLLGAKSVGLCSVEDVNKSVVDSAYMMCAHEPNALRPTNPTIEATLRLDKSSRLIFPTPASTIITSHATNTPTTTASPVTVTASFSQSSSQPSETSETSSPGDAEGAEDKEEEPSPPARFSTAEIAGLAAGIAAAFTIAIVTILLARRRRKKHFPDIETKFFMSNKRLKALSQRFSFMPTGQNISSPLHGSPNAPPREFPMGEDGPRGQRRRTFIFPTAAQRTAPPVRTVPSGTAAPVAGLAITAASAVPTGSSRSSSPRSNQQRPVLSLEIPQSSSSPSPRRQKPASRKGEDHPPQLLVTAATFEREPGSETARQAKKAAKPTIRTVEEDDSPLTEFEEDDRDSPIQVWRPPSLGPQSATPLYVADKFGNWVLANERQKKRISRAELEGSSPVVFNKGGGFPAQTQPKAPAPPKAAGALRPPAEIHKQGEMRREMPSVASSVYSSDIPGWKSSSPAPPVPTHPMLPRPLAPRQPGPVHPRYSPVLNPFLDDNGVSPVRSMMGGMRAPLRTHTSPRAGAGPARVGPLPVEPSPALGAERNPRGRRAEPRTQIPQPRTPQRSYSPVRHADFGATPAQPPSLLAKRVGAEKAASLSLRDSEGSRGSGGRGQLPSTPTWNPLLTPERRGGDLYLSLR